MGAMAGTDNEPGRYSREVMDRVYSLMAEGMSLKQICRMEGMPNTQSVQEWIMKYPAVEGDLYARARDLQAESYAADIVEIADTELDPQVARNRIDARKWVASKLAPRRYGDRVEVEHTGNVQGLGPVIIQITAHQPAQPAAQVIDCQPAQAALPDVIATQETKQDK